MSSSTSRTEEATEIADAVDVTLVKASELWAAVHQRRHSAKPCRYATRAVPAVLLSKMTSKSSWLPQQHARRFRKQRFPGQRSILPNSGNSSRDGRLCRPWRDLQQVKNQLYRFFCPIGYFRFELNVWVWSPFLGRTRWLKTRLFLTFWKVTRRKSGRSGKLKKKRFCLKSSGKW